MFCFGDFDNCYDLFRCHYFNAKLVSIVCFSDFITVVSLCQCFNAKLVEGELDPLFFRYSAYPDGKV